MADELHEIHEQAEQARENRELLPITFTLAVLAVFVALVTLLGHGAHTHELLTQNKASDTWAEYQAQSIRQHTYESFAQLMSVLEFKDAPKAETIRAAFESQSQTYAKNKVTLGEQARKFEEEVQTEERRADRYDLGEALLEMALVVTSIALITRRSAFWWAGLALGLAGAVSAATGCLIR